VHNPLSRNRYCGARHSIYRDRGELLSAREDRNHKTDRSIKAGREYLKPVVLWYYIFFVGPPGFIVR